MNTPDEPFFAGDGLPTILRYSPRRVRCLHCAPRSKRFLRLGPGRVAQALARAEEHRRRWTRLATMRQEKSGLILQDERSLLRNSPFIVRLYLETNCFL
jgi:hypothetical protein